LEADREVATAIAGASCQLRFSRSLPNPIHGEDDQRPDHGSDNVPQRNRYAIEGREKSEYAEKKTPDNSAGQTYSYVPRKAEASALPGHHKANKAAAN